MNKKFEQLKSLIQSPGHLFATTPRKKTIIIVIAALAVITLALVLSHNLRKSPKGHRAGESNELLFHPDAVIGITWRAGADTIVLSRKSRNQPWTSDKGLSPEKIQGKLLLMSRLPLQEISSPSSSAVAVSLQFSNNETWDGAYDSGKFVWLTGPHRGQGTRLDPRDEELFQEGRWAFTSMNWDFCEERPVAIELTKGFIKSRQWKLWQAKDHLWYVEIAKQKTKKLNPSLIENWLKTNCQIPVTRILDTSVGFQFSPREELKLTWKSGKTSTYRIDQDLIAIAAASQVLKLPDFMKSLTFMISEAK